MAIQTINIGNVVNDGLGDDLRTAFQKVNANFTELEGSLTVTASNTGSAGSSVFKQKTGTNLEFRRLISGTKILVEELTDSIKINNTQPDGFALIATNSGNVTASSFPNITLSGGNDVDITAFGSTITVNTVLPVTQILTSIDFGPITGEYENSVQFAVANANVDFGTIALPSRLDLDLGPII